MKCDRCLSEKIVENHDCFLQYLENAKTHYIDLREKYLATESTINTLQNEICKLQEVLCRYKEGEQEVKRKRSNDFGADRITNNSNESLDEESFVISSPPKREKKFFTKEPKCKKGTLSLNKKTLSGTTIRITNLQNDNNEPLINCAANDRDVKKISPKCQNKMDSPVKHDKLRQTRLRFDVSQKSIDDKNNIQRCNEERGKENSATVKPPGVPLVSTEPVPDIDDTYDGILMESMDLLRDFLNPNSNLNNLKRMEQDGIAKIQDAVRRKNILKLKTENNEQNKTSLLITPKNEVFTPEKSLTTEGTKVRVIDKNEKGVPEVKNSGETATGSSDEQATQLQDDNINESAKDMHCNECRKYYAYLGERCLDNELKNHVQQCKKMKRNIAINPTPEGFWDPFIKPFDENDPRNETWIDHRHQL